MGSSDALKPLKLLQFQYIWSYRNARVPPGPSNTFPKVPGNYLFLPLTQRVPHNIHSLHPTSLKTLSGTHDLCTMHSYILHVCASIINNPLVRKTKSNLISFTGWQGIIQASRSVNLIVYFLSVMPTTFHRLLVRTEPW